MKKKGRKTACALLALGLVMALAALWMLVATHDVLQYAIVAPSSDEIKQLVKDRGEIDEALMDCVSATTMGGVTAKASVSAGTANGTASIYAVGEGWFEVYPVFLVDGRRITETELARGDKVAMLDADLAFQLFGNEVPENAKVTIGDGEYSVVGTIRHRRGVGDSAEHNVYLPLLAATESQMDTLAFSAVPIPNSGARTMFENTLRERWQGSGSFYSLEKEAMRRMMIVRLLLLVFGVSAILALVRRMSAFIGRRIAAFREGMRWNYFKRMLPNLLATIGLCLLGYGALLAILYGLMSFSIQPLYVFTEWVPENIVEWSSLRSVFWNLTDSASQLVKIGTREMRALEFWGAMLRWGTLCVLWAILLLRRGPKAEK